MHFYIICTFISVYKQATRWYMFSSHKDSFVPNKMAFVSNSKENHGKDGNQLSLLPQSESILKILQIFFGNSLSTTIKWRILICSLKVADRLHLGEIFRYPSHFYKQTKSNPFRAVKSKLSYQLQFNFTKHLCDRWQEYSHKAGVWSLSGHIYSGLRLRSRSSGEAKKRDLRRTGS